MTSRDRDGTVLDADEVDAARARIVATVQEIRTGAYAPAPRHDGYTCLAVWGKGCDYAWVCPGRIEEPEDFEAAMIKPNDRQRDSGNRRSHARAEDRRRRRHRQDADHGRALRAPRVRARPRSQPHPRRDLHQPRRRGAAQSCRRPPPRAGGWSAIRASLDGAWIGTFHGLCVRLLRDRLLRDRLRPRHPRDQRAGRAPPRQRRARRPAQRRHRSRRDPRDGGDERAGGA